MVESALFQSYRESEKAKARRALDEALTRVETAKAEAAAAPNIAPTQEPPAPPAGPASGREPGVAASVRRGLGAIPRRFIEGGQRMADAVYPSTPDDPRGVGSRALNFGFGVLTTMFPFGAFAEQVGADFGEWIKRDAVTDTALREGLSRAVRLQETAGGDPAHREMLDRSVGWYQKMLMIPEAERLQQARAKSGAAAELLAGVIPGYTSPPAKPPKQVHQS